MKPIGGTVEEVRKEKIITADLETKLGVPTFDRRHVSWIREGRQSAEVYARDPQRREELGLPVIVMESEL